jgi:Tfp pilus assembly protein PilO
MDKTRLWIIGAAIVMVVIVALGWVVAIQPQLDAASAADNQTTSIEKTNTQSAAALEQLKKDYKNLPALQSKLVTLQKSVPSDQSIPSFVDELYEIAAKNGLTITNWTAADAQAYKPVQPAAGSAPTATPSPSASSTPAPVVVPTPAVAGPTAGVPPVVSSLITPANFAAVPVTVSVNGPYANILEFLHGTQTGQRLFLVTAFSSAPSTSGPGFDGTVSGLIYVLTQPEAVTVKK